MKEKEEFVTWNPFRFIEDREEALDFLSDALLDKDPKIFLKALKYAIDFFGTANISKYSGLNRESLYKIAHGKRKPNYMTLHKLIQSIADLTEDHIENDISEEESEPA